MVCTTKLTGSGEAMIDDMKNLHAEAEELRKRKADLRERAKASIGEHKTAISELESAIVSLEDGPVKGASLLSRVRASLPALPSLSSFKVSWGVVVLALAMVGYVGWKEGWIPLPGPMPGPVEDAFTKTLKSAWTGVPMDERKHLPTLAAIYRKAGAESVHDNRFTTYSQLNQAITKTRRDAMGESLAAIRIVVNDELAAQFGTETATQIDRDKAATVLARIASSLEKLQ